MSKIEDTEIPPDLRIEAFDEIKIRQDLTQVALGKREADVSIRVGRLLDVHTRRWLEDQEVVVRGKRIAWIGDAGTYPGRTSLTVDRSYLSAVPGFGEVHKHIESSHLTPEWEAALVLPRGNTWTCEASHEFSNVNGERNLEFWLESRLQGSPLKIFPLPGSAVPPTGYEWGGGHFGYEEQSSFLQQSLMVPGLDEVMDWPAVHDRNNPSHDRLWGMIRATFEHRGVVEGHGAGLRDPHSISAFAASGLASDHEVQTPEEVIAKLSRGIFVEIRPYNAQEIISALFKIGLEDWSQIAFTTDDRSASDTLRYGASDHNVRTAMKAGLTPEIAIQCVTINPARHMRLTPWVGSVSPGRYADMVLLDDVASLSIAEVWADGTQISEGSVYKPEVPRIEWPDWAVKTVKIEREIVADDFAIAALPGRETMTAAILRPFHWKDDFETVELPVEDGAVLRDHSQNITKFAMVDRFSGNGLTSKMFWRGCGPSTKDTALACTVAHDKHNLWVVGSSDKAMALAANTMKEQQGGWVLVREGAVAATVRYEIGGLMSCRSAEELDAEMQNLYAEAEQVNWMWEQSPGPRWEPGFPERLIFATLTCSPWRWVLVAPTEAAPQGFVNVSTGETHDIVW
ncbi:adenine deaminase [Palleronia aestuarii]|uniref:Adenine deaminase n=1 Tax=Palleronia aestuarii TaxID=568105 RepID=A0A2W7NIL1_9RHOB|nr:adenine deaminase C-terminal domain-containing protein [Palleronia aestuarii]PZX13016.1 adenine deaminase [Palleronia aestuarii]